MIKLTELEKRAERHYARVRTRNPICITCGFNNDLAALHYSHIIPRRFHDDGAVQCLNCHAALSDIERAFPYSPQTQNPTMETIGRYLLALAEWMRRIAETIAAFGAWLLVQAEHVLPYQPEEAA